MSEWWLISLLVVMTFFASIIILRPLKADRRMRLFLLPIVFLLASMGYWFWGGFSQWQHYAHSQVLVKKALQSLKSPQELIIKLKTKLQAHPESAKGWYLLGRLYSSQSDYQNAVSAFAIAYRLEPLEEQCAVNYAHSLWQTNKQQFNAEIIGIFNRLLKNNPNQPDALAMLAMNAFLGHAYEEAINYWQRLIQIVPENSAEALTIRQAIAKAQERIDSGRKKNDG